MPENVDYRRVEFVGPKVGKELQIMGLKAILYSFILTLTLSQLANKQSGINNVVNKTKKIEIPSIPKEKFKFEDGIHAKSQTNWKRT